MSTPSAHDNFDQWLDAYLIGHPIHPEPELCEYTLDDMFSAWVGGAIFTANRMFNPSRPGVPPLPDIFQAAENLPDKEYGVEHTHPDDPERPGYTSPHYLGGPVEPGTD
jgi:hypothetical protein